MPTEDAEEKRALLKRELGGRGYVIHLATSREGANLIAHLDVSEAATDKSLVRLVSVAKVDDLNLLIGVDAKDEVLREILAQLFGFADAIRDLVPTVTIHEE